MHKLAKCKEGKRLSTEYNNNKEKLIWQCQKGHIWEARPDSIVSGRWCPECSNRKKLTIEDMISIAEKRGGKCLSEIYSPTTPLIWQCAKGHVWAALSNNVKRGQWCRKCSGSFKLTIEEMKQIAKDKGGECLSNQYKDNKTKLRWNCHLGHEWAATPNNIKSKRQWCPTCTKIKEKEKKHPI